MTGNSSNSVAAPIFDEEIGAEEATMKEVGDCEIDAVAGFIVVLSAFASPGGVFRSSKARSGVRAWEKVVVMIFSNITVLFVAVVISLVGTEVVEGVVGAIDVWPGVLGWLVTGPDSTNIWEISIGASDAGADDDGDVVDGMFVWFLIVCEFWVGVETALVSVNIGFWLSIIWIGSSGRAVDSGATVEAVATVVEENCVCTAAIVEITLDVDDKIGSWLNIIWTGSSGDTTWGEGFGFWGSSVTGSSGKADLLLAVDSGTTVEVIAAVVEENSVSGIAVVDVDDGTVSYDALGVFLSAESTSVGVDGTGEAIDSDEVEAVPDKIECIIRI